MVGVVDVVVGSSGGIDSGSIRIRSRRSSVKGDQRGKGRTRQRDDSWPSGGNRWDNWGSNKHEIEYNDIRALREAVFMLQRLALRHEDFLAALRPELNFVMFARTDVPATVVPSIFNAQKARREDKASKPETIDHPMRSCLLSCMFRELSARIEALMKDPTQQERLVRLGWLGATPIKWHYLKWDASSSRLKPDASREPVSFEQAAAVIASLTTLASTTQVFTRFHPTRPIEAEMKGKNLVFQLQIALLGQQAQQVREHLDLLSGLAVTQLFAAAFRRERGGRS